MFARASGNRIRICLIDLDPQAHATLHLGVEPAGRPGAADGHGASIYDVLTGKTRLSEARRQVAENLWLVGSTLDLAAADMELAGVVGREMILRDKLRAKNSRSTTCWSIAPPRWACSRSMPWLR